MAADSTFLRLYLHTLCFWLTSHPGQESDAESHFLELLWGLGRSPKSEHSGLIGAGFYRPDGLFVARLTV